jgi:hypothetical protein
MAMPYLALQGLAIGTDGLIGNMVIQPKGGQGFNPVDIRRLNRVQFQTNQLFEILRGKTKVWNG